MSPIHSARNCLAAALISLAAGSALTASSALAGSPVIELFTSQGCSSCPPADEFLGELAKAEGVIALSMPVDYWDYLGWKDSFGSPQHSARQKAYAHARGDRAVYTPQIVVNGSEHVVGSDRQSVRQALAAAAASVVDVSIEMDATSIRIDLPAGQRPAQGNAVVWLVGFSNAEPVAIVRGENAGRQIVYHNVVRKMARIGRWDGTAGTIEIPRSRIWDQTVNGCAVLVQEDRYAGTGPIIGAALMHE